MQMQVGCMVLSTQKAVCPSVACSDVSNNINSVVFDDDENIL